MDRRGASRTTRQTLERLSPCVCRTLRMVTRAVTQLYDDVLRPSGLRVTQFSILETLARLGEANLRQLEDTLAIDQTTLTRSLNLLQRDGVIERIPHPDGRIKALRPTAKGRRALEVARPLWAQAQNQVLGELGTKAWADARRRLAHCSMSRSTVGNGGGDSPGKEGGGSPPEAGAGPYHVRNLPVPTTSGAHGRDVFHAVHGHRHGAARTSRNSSTHTRYPAARARAHPHSDRWRGVTSFAVCGRRRGMRSVHAVSGA